MRGKTYCFILVAIFMCTVDLIDGSHNDENAKSKVKKNSPTEKSSSSFKGLFFLIGLIGVILGGIFIYYLFLCHPILCRKERNYDVVEHSRDTTPTRNIEKTP